MAVCDHTDYISLSGLILGTGCCQLQLNKHLCEMFFCVFMPAHSICLFIELGCNCFCPYGRKPATIILMVNFNLLCNPFPQVSS